MRGSSTSSRIDEKTLKAVTAMAEATRIQILFQLGGKNGKCVGDIAGSFSISRPAVSHHLRILKENGLVLSTRDGQEIYYRVNRAYLAEVLRTLADSLQSCCTDAGSIG
jgi:ArsR family transcriptional regulator, arsenate/arsenite/antimonite-responsive transcriptional repressor